jgi:hypothetical protein
MVDLRSDGLRLFGHAALASLAAAAVLGAAAFCSARAQETPGGRTPSPPGAAVYFVDLQDGARLPPKATIRFGVKNMEVAPAGSDKENSGHHHLLIDTELPPLDHEIPNDFNHLHFGRGQTEAEVSLSPGEHTLQLLLGDKDHIPHSPPVMSAPVRVVVAEDAPSAGAGAPGAEAQRKRQPAPPDAKVFFIYPHSGDIIFPRSTIRFGLSNMGVAPAGVAKAGTGHHHLLVDVDTPPPDVPIPNDFNHMHFGGGQTEVRLELPPGTHTLQLVLADENHVPHDPPIMSERIKVTVKSGGAKRRRR